MTKKMRREKKTFF